MRLTVYTDFSLRLLMYLAVRTEGLATIAEIAESYGIAKNHLTKVAHQLGRGGYVTTVRGNRGGLRLAKPAAEINLGEVVRYCEPDLALVPCFEPVCSSCPIIPACELRGALHQAQSVFMEVLNRYTLADLTNRKTDLRTLLGVPAISPPGRDQHFSKI